MNTERTSLLMRRVAQRDGLSKLAGALRLGLVLAGAVGLLWLLAARLGSLVAEPRPALFFGTLALAAAGAAAFFFKGRLSQSQAARLIDSRLATKELFLSATLAGVHEGFGAIVTAQAEERAAAIAPRQVVPFHWQNGARDIGCAALAVALAFGFLPQFDPFGAGRQRTALSAQAKRLAELKKATVTRAEQLAQQPPREASPVEKALAALEKTFKEAKPQERERNLADLAAHQKEIGELWRKTSAEMPRDAFERASQSFGRADAKKAEQWREDLKKGDLSDIKKEIAEMRDQLKKLAAMPDSAEKRALQQQLAQRLGTMADAAKQAGGSPQANAALARALEQLDKAKLSELSDQATQDAMESLDLSEKELAEMAEKMKDGQSLEEALKALQMAKQLAAAGKLEGKPGEGECKMGDYANLFAEKMSDLAGKGPGQGGPGMGEGIGDGSPRPENDATKTAFKTEKDKGPLSNGKMLMEWKSREVGPSGARPDDFQAALSEVKQGVSEAIAAEQVPPGYHSAIQKYFDALPAKP